MRDAHPVEQAVGMRWYASDGPGVGGRLRSEPENFRVREIEAVDTAPLDADPGAYAHLVLRATLHGWDTHDFADALASAIGISRERVSWAGTKDKHALTTQLFSVEGIEPPALPTFDGVDLEAIGRAGRPVLFGDLAGNEFEVVVSDPDRPAGVDAVTADLQGLLGRPPDSPDETLTIAVPNYFGQQRFGSRRPVTHEVGLAIARDDWEGAVMAYVGNPAEREPAETQQARALVDRTHDWQAALAAFPTPLGHERAMLHRLDEQTNGGADAASPADFRAAIEAVSTSLQRLFVNAAQSYVFNLIVSERLERELPLCRPVAGDVVCFADRDAPEQLAVPDPERRQRVTADRVETVRRHCDRGRAFVTAPLVGTETSLGEGEPGEIERAVLENVALEPADFDLPGAFDSAGTRRAVAVRTDLAIARDPLTFRFALPPGAYATVLLREYLKVDPASL